MSNIKTYVIIALVVLVGVLGFTLMSSEEPTRPNTALIQSEIDEAKVRAIQTIDATVEEADLIIVDKVQAVPPATNEIAGETIEEAINDIDEIVQDAVEDIQETAEEAAEEVGEEAR